MRQSIKASNAENYWGDIDYYTIYYFEGL